MTSSPSRSSTDPQAKDPGAYPVPFSFGGVELGSRLDSISPSIRYWAVNPLRAHMSWYNDLVEANCRYEDWLSTRPPGEYPVPFKPAERKRIDEIEDGLRYWAVRPERSSSLWYDSFVRANERYEQYLAKTRAPGEFPYPKGNNREYAGLPIKEVPQDVVWWALRSSNHNQGWYQPLYDANKRMLDEEYKVRSPGSVSIWFGTRYRGLRLDQVLQRKSFIRWCFDPKMAQEAKFRRLKDLVDRLKEWRRAHPERSGPRQRRRAPIILNPVGEAIGPWDDSLGSAGEDDYDRDSFIQSDSEEPEYTGDDGDEAKDNGNDSRDSDGSTSSSMEVISIKYPGKRRRPNVVLSDEEEANIFARGLGKRYRV